MHGVAGGVVRRRRGRPDAGRHRKTLARHHPLDDGCGSRPPLSVGHSRLLLHPIDRGRGPRGPRDVSENQCQHRIDLDVTEPGTDEGAQLCLVLVVGVWTEHRTRTDGVEQPRMSLIELPIALGNESQRGPPPTGNRCRLVDVCIQICQGPIDHQVRQLLTPRHVGVQRHRTDPEMLGHIAHRHRLQPVRIGHLDCRVDDRVDAQAGSARFRVDPPQQFEDARRIERVLLLHHPASLIGRRRGSKNRVARTAASVVDFTGTREWRNWQTRWI